MSEHTDAELVEQARQGNRAAFDLLVTRHRAGVIAAAAAIMTNPHDADDIAQDAFLTAYMCLRHLREPERFGQWVRTIAHNTACRRKRRRARETSLENIQVPIAPPWRGDDDTDPRSEAIWKALAGLSETLRPATVLHYIYGYSIGEIARTLELPEGTVKRRLHDARKQLKRRISDEIRE